MLLGTLVGSHAEERHHAQRTAMYREHYLPQMWAANIERLRRSDPDLFS